MSQNPAVVLLTDFGVRDPYAGILRGVIASISPDTRVIDLTHEISPRDILEAAFVLAVSFAWFPRGSVFCAVVDPGVGSKRKAICIRTVNYWFVGPDNGLLWEAANRDGISHVIHLNQPEWFHQPVSATFHGRDVFAPVAARIAQGVDDLSRLGQPLTTCVRAPFPEPEETDDGLLLRVIHIDRFGNLILNLTWEQFKRRVGERHFQLRLNGKTVRTFCATYAEAPDIEFFVIHSSLPYVEIALKNADAARQLNAARLDRALLKTGNQS